jgi:hypothetical protein
MVPRREPASSRQRTPPVNGVTYFANGAILIVSDRGRTSVAVSAPLTPCADTALPFEFFAERCASHYSEIHRSASALAPAEYVATVRGVARCARERYDITPYWIPQRVLNGDVCRKALDPDWQLPSAQSLERISDEVRGALLEALPYGPHFWFYNSPVVFARSASNEIGLTALIEIPQISWFAADPARPLEEDGIVVRCLRFGARREASRPVPAQAARCGDQLEKAP